MCQEQDLGRRSFDANPLARAGTAYVSSYFSKNRAYAKTFGEGWCILSARFGLVLPEEEIENYNVTFKHRTSELVTVAKLIEQVAAKRLGRFRVIHVLGGEAYVERVVCAFAGSGVTIRAPLAGLRIGEAMHAIQEAVDSGSPL